VRGVRFHDWRKSSLANLSNTRNIIANGSEIIGKSSTLILS